MARSPEDVIGFRRIFVLFCTLVLLPAMLVSGFGVVAIGNERSAQKQRQREGAEVRLKAAEARIAGLLDASDDAVAQLRPSSVASDVRPLRAAGLAIGPFMVLSELGQLQFAEPPFGTPEGASLTEQVRMLGADLEVGQRKHAQAASRSVQGVLCVHRTSSAGLLLSHLIDLRALEHAASIESDGSGFSIGLAAPTGPRVSTSEAADVAQLWMRADERASHLQIAGRPLPSPLEGFQLIAIGAEPPVTIVVVYIVLLSLFYVLLIIGVVLTSRLIWREAKLSRLKTDFVSHVSHELRTPLTSIRMFIETLRLGRAESEADREECLDLLGKETERLSEMIERVLGYARLKSGRRIFNLRAVAVDDVIDDAMEAFRAQTLGANVASLSLTREIEQDLPAVVGDRDALAEALLNLMGNAWKYTGPDKRIRVFAVRRRRRVTLGVEDNGPGLPKSEHGRIFDRFYQAGADLLARQSKGSGLGLAITKGIVEGNRGKIHIESEVGKGATFTIDLRIAPATSTTEVAALSAGGRALSPDPSAGTSP